GKNLTRLRYRRNARALKGPIWTLKFNQRGTRMATGGQDGKVVVWDLAAASAAPSKP
ncbi:unnamed protein product, partial [Laminaria digitata]